MTMRKLPLHTQIFIGMFLGVALGMLSLFFGWNPFISDWVKPFGAILINLLKLLAMPLILVSLISGISSLKDISRLSRIGGRTMIFYMVTTVLAILIGLALVNTTKPGNYLSKEKQIRPNWGGSHEKYLPILLSSRIQYCRVIHLYTFQHPSCCLFLFPSAFHFDLGFVRVSHLLLGVQIQDY